MYALSNVFHSVTALVLAIIGSIGLANTMGESCGNGEKGLARDSMVGPLAVFGVGLGTHLVTWVSLLIYQARIVNNTNQPGKKSFTRLLLAMLILLDNVYGVGALAYLLVELITHHRVFWNCQSVWFARAGLVIAQSSTVLYGVMVLIPVSLLRIKQKSLCLAIYKPIAGVISWFVLVWWFFVSVFFIGLWQGVWTGF